MQFKTWKTIKLGTGLKTGDDFSRAFKEAGCSIEEWPNRILNNPNFQVANKENEIELVKVSVGQLVYFKNSPANTRVIYACAETYFGLGFCPPEVGPQLRLQYLDQPKDEYLRIAMNPISHTHETIHFAFDVQHERSSGMLLGGYDDPGMWDQNDLFIFCQRR
jgi:hypothetical protein